MFDTETISETPAVSPSREVCLPLEALSMPDESEKLEEPAQGDKVSATIEGTVNRVEGSHAYVTLDAVNGHELKPGESIAEPSEENELASLQEIARGMPEKY